ncbi:MAG: type II toxin-antitoxin system RelE/ParE family toxin [Candidatus Bipolaricaulota bacterium]|nr:type II toxin-antitoxin system RelE/ParE family toxin [Candidatus Bipolaricaulota bacterium]MCS7274109.1 type II toxin-antitoxin system RelE/ParE family toxin [Candidatus Bipolaricaulota bacterium]MDW8111282.1 type II toxin-antitoxin system RelE/ParE family toxin [Candidatus Bipolaricaulota bacterium]MDW8328582.1 type II toxin-antitoxin system RelE/ParE family toxin [Candidatus Bipolaricaulota bacterium]
MEEAAQRDLRRLDPVVARRVRQRLLELEQNPRPPGVRKLRDVHPPGYRVRVGDWRILYSVDDQAKEVRVYRIKHRARAY